MTLGAHFAMRKLKFRFCSKIELFWKHLIASLKDRNFLSNDHLLNNPVILKTDTSKTKLQLTLFCYLRDSTFGFAETKGIFQLFNILTLISLFRQSFISLKSLSCFTLSFLPHIPFLFSALQYSKYIKPNFSESAGKISFSLFELEVQFTKFTVHLGPL